MLCPGTATGEVLRLDTPISFWGGVDPVTSRVTAAGHPQSGMAIAGTMLVLPQLIGSSSSSAILLELIYQGLAPQALILGSADAILPMGAVVAEEMGWGAIPVVQLLDPPFVSGELLRLHADGLIEKE